MVGFALEDFEARAEAFVSARAWRERQFLSGFRPGRGLVTLYDDDFPDFTSRDLWADLQSATPEDPRQLTRLSALLAAAYLEAHTRPFATAITRLEANASVAFEEQTIHWREVPARWLVPADVPRRHELEDSWRGVFRSELNPQLERWNETFRTELVPLGPDPWLDFWSTLRGFDVETVARLSESILDQTSDVYGHGMTVYLGQLDLPIDDVWTSDVDWAFRAPRFDAVFPEIERIPRVIRSMRDLGIELEEETNIHLEYGPQPGVTAMALEVPDDIRVGLRLIGGWQDLAHSLRGLGMAEHLAHSDRTLRVWERWLGDDTPNAGYGLLLEGLVRDRTWLNLRLEYAANDDFRVIAHLAWLYRVRRSAGMALYEQRLWRAEPGASMAADFEEAISTATRSRTFPEEYLRLLLNSPWSMLKSAQDLRAEVFSAQLRLFLKREFDEEWWRSSRAARFLVDELWRPGKRYSAEELLGFMGYEGFDPAVLVAEFLEILQPL